MEIFWSVFIISISTIIWTIPFLCILPFGIKLYKISDREQIQLINKKIKYSSFLSGNNHDGIIIGKWFIGYLYEIINNNQNNQVKQQNLWIISSNSFFSIITNNEQEQQEKNIISKEIIKIYDRKGNFFWLEYKERILDVTRFIATREQEIIINTIINKYNKNYNCVSFIYGLPGKGKSTIGILLAKQLKGSIVRKYNPTDPGDKISTIYSEITPTENNPLIIVIDEIDIILERISKTKLTHKYIPIEVPDLSGWNILLDDINLGLYKYLILLLTTNINPNEIKTRYGEACIRPNRVDYITEL
jgi:hypothetical protein